MPIYSSQPPTPRLTGYGELHPEGQYLNYGNFRQVKPPPLPCKTKQQQIAGFLDRETTRIDALMKTIERSIILLKERQAAFITAAVTGQIDLRGK